MKVLIGKQKQSKEVTIVDIVTILNDLLSESFFRVDTGKIIFGPCSNSTRHNLLLGLCAIHFASKDGALGYIAFHGENSYILCATDRAKHEFYNFLLSLPQLESIESVQII